MYIIPFSINDNSNNPPLCNRPVEVIGTHEEVNHLVEQGYLQIDNFFNEDELEKFRLALDRVINKEINDPATEHLEGNGHYIRSLLDKDADFLPLLSMDRPMSVSRAVLGPQVWFDAEARVVPAGIEGLAVNWHIHHRVIPDPLPPLFCYPHAIHGLLYLDDTDYATGPICILPGSHLHNDLKIEKGDNTNKENQLILPLKAGTILLLHANLWHRTLPTTTKAGTRRVILFGYTPAWIKSDIARGVKPDNQITRHLRENGNLELRELLGEFYW